MESKKNISAKRVVITSFFVDVLDIVLSVIAAYTSGSIVMVTQVLEGLSDLSSSGLLYIGVFRSRKLPDKSHPFGYGRELYFWTLIAALIMFGFPATSSIYFGWERFMSPEPIHDLPFALGVLIITVFTNGYALFLSIKRLVRRHGSYKLWNIFIHSTLVETKTTLVLDLMGTIASIIGIFSFVIYSITGDLRFDGIGAMVMGVVLAFLSYFLILGIKDLLIGRTASPSVEARIRKHSLSIPEVEEVLDLKTMHIGPERLLVNMEVHLKNHLTTDEIEKLIDKIKAKVQTEIPAVKHIQIELEAPD